MEGGTQVNSNDHLRIKCDKIRRIQARGLRVLILQSGKVEVWPKGEPGNVSRYSCLDHADFDTELGEIQGGEK